MTVFYVCPKRACAWAIPVALGQSQHIRSCDWLKYKGTTFFNQSQGSAKENHCEIPLLLTFAPLPNL